MHVTGIFYDPSPNDEPYLSDIRCEHGKGQPDAARRTPISPAVRRAPLRPSIDTVWLNLILAGGRDLARRAARLEAPALRRL